MLGLWVRIPPGTWMSLVSVCVCCQVEISARGQSLVQRSHTKCGVSQCDLKISTMMRPSPTMAVEPWKKLPPFMKLTAPNNSLFMIMTALQHNMLQRGVSSTSGVPRGGFGEFKHRPPAKFWRPSKIVPNSTRLWKLLKIAEFRTPTPQDVQKKKAVKS